MKLFMKQFRRTLGPLLGALLWLGSGNPLPGSGITINWGNAFFDEVVDSFNEPLSASGDLLDGDFVFQLGVFVNDFDFETVGRNNWIDHWRVFDQADFNPDLGVFASSANLLSDGSSDSEFASAGTDFANAEAFLWIRNSNTMSPGTGDEWFLARADNWVFPDAPPEEECCTDDPLEWVVNDLANQNVVPIWGTQSGNVGGGLAHEPNEEVNIQTHAIPEPVSGSILAFLGISVLIYRRWKRKGLKNED